MTVINPGGAANGVGGLPNPATAGMRPVASGGGVAVTFEPVTEYDARMDYGLVWDGITDDGAGLSAALADVGSKRGRLVLPARNPSGAFAPMKTTTTITTPWTYGVSIRGQGKEASVISQATSNIPVLNIGGGAGAGPLHSNHFEDFQLTYAIAQPATNTNAIAMLFSQMMYESTIRSVFFDNCFYAMQVASTIFAPWGNYWNDLLFGQGITGGAMDWSAVGIGAVPSNRWGKFYALGPNMVGPVFKSIWGENWTWDNLELNSMNAGPQIMTLRAGSRLSMGGLKLEIGHYTSAMNGLALIQGNGSDIEIDQLNFLGDVNPNDLTWAGTGNLYMIGNGQFAGGLPGKVKVRCIDSAWTVTGGGSVFVFGPGGGALTVQQYEIDTPRLSGGIQLTDSIGGATLDTARVHDWINDHVSQDAGDANYTVVVPSPNIVMFNTALTAQRTIALPAVQQLFCNGLYYQIAFSPGVLTNFGAIITCNAVTIATIPAQTTGVIIRYAARRSAVSVQACWRCTNYNVVPAAGIQV